MRTPQGNPRDVAALESLLEGHRAAGRCIVLTNGAFDVLHVGHVRALEEARSLGDVLVVGLNSDASVRTRKGSGRPLVPEDERAEILAALACVDVVTIFDEPTADALLRRVRPDVYAKGRDYDASTLPESQTALSLGARLVFVGDEKQHSASELVRRLGAERGPEGEGARRG